MTNADFERIANATAYSATGDKLGRIGQIYLDDASNQPSFVSVKTGLFGLSESLVPLEGHSWNGEDLVLPYEKDVVKDAPNIDADRHLSEQEQDELFAYYGRIRGGDGSGRPRPDGLSGETAGLGGPTGTTDLLTDDADRTAQYSERSEEFQRRSQEYDDQLTERADRRDDAGHKAQTTPPGGGIVGAGGVGAGGAADLEEPGVPTRNEVGNEAADAPSETERRQRLRRYAGETDLNADRALDSQGDLGTERL